MSPKQALSDILKKATLTLEDNKTAAFEIISTCYSNYNQKLQELIEIEKELPLIITQLKELSVLDKEFRQKLSICSYDFSQQGHEHLKRLFEEASIIHTQLLQLEKHEQNLIKRRNILEVELQKNISEIHLAESMVQQLAISLTYLQNGMNQLDISTAQEETASIQHYLSLFKFVENEKLSIARDLHDGPTQEIVSVQMRLDFCKNMLLQDLNKGFLLIDQLKDNLSHAISEIREILFRITPAPLESLGLKNSIDNILYNSFNNTCTKVQFIYNVSSSNIDIEFQGSIYRIVQELISNIKKHAYAPQVTLTLCQQEQLIHIEVIDNGVGFDIDEYQKNFSSSSKSYGFTNLYTRIKELNGSIKIKSSQELGTYFNIKIPIITI